MVVFRYNEDGFAMINHITPNRSFWISSEPSPESLQIVQNFAGWKLSAVYVNQTNLNVKSTTKLEGQAGGQQKNWVATAHPVPP